MFRISAKIVDESRKNHFLVELQKTPLLKAEKFLPHKIHCLFSRKKDAKNHKETRNTKNWSGWGLNTDAHGLHQKPLCQKVPALSVTSEAIRTAH